MKSPISNHQSTSHIDCKSETIGYKKDKISRSLHEKLEFKNLEHKIKHVKSRGDGFKGRWVGAQNNPKYSLIVKSRCSKHESWYSGTRLPKGETVIQPAQSLNKKLGRYMSSKEVRPISEFVKWFMSIEPLI